MQASCVARMLRHGHRAIDSSFMRAGQRAHATSSQTYNACAAVHPSHAVHAHPEPHTVLCCAPKPRNIYMQAEAAEHEVSAREAAAAAAMSAAATANGAAAEHAAAAQRAVKAAEGAKRQQQVAERARCTAAAAAKVKRGQLAHRGKQRRLHEQELAAAEAAAAAADAALGVAQEAAAERTAALCAPAAGVACSRVWCRVAVPLHQELFLYTSIRCETGAILLCKVS